MDTKCSVGIVLEGVETLSLNKDEDKEEERETRRTVGTDFNREFLVKKFSTSHHGNVIIDEGEEVRIHKDTEECSGIHCCLVLGSSGVGKTSICSQLGSSEHTVHFEDSLFRTNVTEGQVVAVQMKNTIKRFLLMDTLKETYDESLMASLKLKYNVQRSSVIPVFLVIFCIDRRHTLETAGDLLASIRYFHPEVGTQLILLLGNKVDLARNRQVTEEEGTTLALKYGATYIEVSSGLEYNMETVLVKMMEELDGKAQATERHRKKTSVREKMKCLIAGKSSTSSRSPSPRVIRLER